MPSVIQIFTTPMGRGINGDGCGGGGEKCMLNEGVVSQGCSREYVGQEYVEVAV